MLCLLRGGLVIYSLALCLCFLRFNLSLSYEFLEVEVVLLFGIFGFEGLLVSFLCCSGLSILVFFVGCG
jgi:hypothetical protein